MGECIYLWRGVCRSAEVSGEEGAGLEVRMGEVGPLVPKGFVSSVIELVPLVLIVRGLAL